MKPDTAAAMGRVAPSPAASATTPPTPIRRSPIGTNLDDVRDWHTDPPFENMFKGARGWIGGTIDAWNPADPIDADARGNLRSLRPGQVVRTILLTSVLQHFAGPWTLSWEGEADVSVDGMKGLGGAGGGGAVKTKTGPNEWTIAGVVPPWNGLETDERSMIVTIHSVNPANPPRNFDARPVRTIRNNGTFRHEFVSRLSIYSGLRFLGWMGTNDHPGPVDDADAWSKRPMVEDVFWTGERGVPLEVMIELCNRTGCAPWLPVPHAYDEAAIGAALEIVHERLAPQLGATVSHANEIWNGGKNEKESWGFAQAWKLQDAGIAMGLGGLESGGNRVWAAARLHARRTARIGAIARATCFGGGRAVTVVLDSAHGELHRHQWMREEIEAFTGKAMAQSIDRLSTAPYFGYRFGDHALRDKNWNVIDPTWGGQVLKMTPKAIATRLVREDVPMTLETLAADAAWAKAAGIGITCYETGQHTSAVGDRKKIVALVDLLTKANREPMMGKAYAELFAGFRRMGVAHPHHFTHSGRWTEHGAWGSIEGAWQQPRASVKRAALESIARWPRWWEHRAG